MQKYKFFRAKVLYAFI